MTTEADHRLPRTAVPSHYAVTLEPDLDSASFTGRVSIDLYLADEAFELVLNAAEIEVTHAELQGADFSHRVGAATHDEDAERVTIDFGEPLGAGAYQLRLDFTGSLNDQLRGFYLSRFNDDDGGEHLIASTQFEATDARRAFPCWDEPDLKAEFTITLVVGPDLQAVSNSPIVSEEATAEGKRRITFGRTMKMSTYLVAFVVGELEATEWVDVDGTPLRIVHVPGKGHLTDFALEVGAFALRFFEDYYGVPYPGDKVDMIGIPDFAFGAMENLGAVTYRETVLLIDPAKATQAELQRVADVIAHELAHMWFGDLVTMRWWNGIWLNEAFATFMEVKCVDAFRPEWKRWLNYSAERHVSMDIDGLASTRPIEFPVGSPAEANAMFDVLTYEKGGSVLRMLEVYLGEEVFRRGISRYLKHHAYDNTETGDLWAALAAESGEPVADIMDSWILQGGHPRIDVSATDDGYTLRQEQFRFIGEGEHRWLVPVLYSSSSGDGRVLLSGEETIPAGDDLVVNAGGQGYFRTRYDAELFAGIANRVGDLDDFERFALVSDTWAGVLAGYVEPGAFLDLVSRFGAEGETHVWNVVLGGLGELDRVVPTETRSALQGFVRRVVGPAAVAAGWEPVAGESDLDRARRGVLLRALGVLGADPATVDRARELFPAVLAADGTVDDEVASAVGAIVAANGDLEVHERIAAAYAAASTPQAEDRFLAALPSVPLESAAAETLTMVLDGRIRSHNSSRTVARLVANRDVGAAVWGRLTERWDDVLATMPALTRRYSIETIYLRSDIAGAIESWLAEHPLPGVEKYTAQQLERLAVRVNLRANAAGLRVG